jgi:leucyl aminopeptidase
MDTTRPALHLERIEPRAVAGDLLALPCFQGDLRAAPIAGVDAALDGALLRLEEEESFAGKKDQTLLVHTLGKAGASRVLLLGMGPRAELALPELRHFAARAVRTGARAGARSVAVALPADECGPVAVQLAAEGALLGRYRFDRYLTGDRAKPDKLETVRLLVHPEAPRDGSLERAVERGRAVAGGVIAARDLVNAPASEVTPDRLAEHARDIAARSGGAIECKVLGRPECAALGMNLYLAVAAGSDREPRFIHLSYRPAGATRRFVAIGKGITFDSGGLSLKPANAMEDMKIDMAGGAVVLTAAEVVARLGSPYEFHAICAATENMPSGKAYRPGDVFTGMGGKSVEVLNTDAEGRLTLADALAYAVQLQPQEIVDLATLTGACMVALGPHIAGVMGNDQAFVDRWLATARAAGEDMWQLPLPERLREAIKSEVADMKNIGERWGGAITAGLFLKEFAGDVPWVHVDLAAPASMEKEYGIYTKGGTGFALATMVEYLCPRS